MVGELCRIVKPSGRIVVQLFDGQEEMSSDMGNKRSLMSVLRLSGFVDVIEVSNIYISQTRKFYVLFCKAYFFMYFLSFLFKRLCLADR